MAVNFEAAVASAGSGTFNTTISTTITLGGANTSRAVLVGLQFDVNTVTGVSVTVGGQLCSLITGTDTGTNNPNLRSMLFGLATGLTGSQTVTASWTGSSGVVIGAISALGVNQSTPFNHGTSGFQNSPQTSISLAVTSNAGDLTSSLISYTPAGATTNQTVKWTGNDASNDLIAGQDIGPGTGTTTHTWTNASGISYAAISGANFVQAQSSLANITCHSAVVAHLGSLGKIVSPITGHSVVSGTLTSPKSNITGHSVVVANLKAKGVLVGSSAGHATVTGNPPKSKSNITGHSAISAHLTGSGALQGQFKTITIVWTAAIDPVDGYNIYRGPSSGAESTVPLNPTLILTTSYTDASPQPGNNFYIVKSSLGGVLSVAGQEQGIISLSCAITGHSTVSATVANSSSHIISSIAGHSSVAASITGLGKRVTSITGHAVLNQFPKGVLTGKGALVGSSTGHAVIFANIKPSIGSPMVGHAVVTANLKASGALTGSLTGHAVVTASVKATARIVSSITGHSVVHGSVQAVNAHGHAVVTALIKGIGGIGSSITGSSVVLGVVKTTGVLVSPITGSSFVRGSGVSALASSNGHAVVTGNLSGSVLSASSFITGQSAVSAIIGTVALQGCFGRAFITARLSGAGGLEASCLGEGDLEGQGQKTKVYPIVRSFGVDSARPGLILTKSNSLQIFTQAFDQPFDKHFNAPISSSPDGIGIPGYTVMPGQLLVIPVDGKSQGRQYLVQAAGTVIMPPSVPGSFSIVLSQNYFSMVGKKPTLIRSVPLLTIPIYTNVPVQPGAAAGWEISRSLPGNLGYVQLSIGVQFTGTPTGSDLFEATLSQFNLQRVF